MHLGFDNIKLDQDSLSFCTFTNICEGLILHLVESKTSS